MSLVCSRLCVINLVKKRIKYGTTAKEINIQLTLHTLMNINLQSMELHQRQRIESERKKYSREPVTVSELPPMCA